jgi:hypothetical protein
MKKPATSAGHSKSPHHHTAMKPLFVAWYNFPRKHDVEGHQAVDGQQANGPRMDDQRTNRESGLGPALRSLPFFLLAVHSIAVIAIGLLIGVLLRAGYQEAVQLWTLAIIIDLPAWSLLAIAESAARPVLETKGDIIWWVLFPTGNHLVVGGLTWFLFGWLIERIRHRAKK